MSSAYQPPYSTVKSKKETKNPVAPLNQHTYATDFNSSSHHQALAVYESMSPKIPYLKSRLSDLHYVKEGPIIQWGLRKRKPKDRYMFILSDVLVICRRLKKGKYLPRWIILLNHKKACESVKDSSYHIPDVEFRLYTPRRTFLFFAGQQSERDSWFSTMSSIIRESEKRENPTINYADKNDKDDITNKI